MKKISILLFLIICLFIINVKADELPVVISHLVMVTNKDGTTCFKNGEKTDQVIPYKTMLTVNTDINGSYIKVVNDEYDCDVKYSDVSSNSQKFSLENKDVSEIASVRAIVLSNTGLNMRIGPSVTYAKIMTIPANTLLTLTHKAGTFWYYTEYNGKSGWITSMNKYIGFDDNKVLINYEKAKLYGTNGITVLANIPENTEITNYVKLESFKENDFKYYVDYNGTKGYIKDMLYKTNGTGKIKLVKDVELKDENGNPIKRMSSGSELEYSMVTTNGFYIIDKKTVVNLNDDDYEYIKKTKIMVKEKGYLGEGVFGEEIKEREIVSEIEENDPEEPIKEENNDNKELIIIILLVGIFILLIVLIILKIINNKKNRSNLGVRYE